MAEVLKPVLDKILIKVIEAPKKVGNIFLPDSDGNKNNNRGKVLAVGPGIMKDGVFETVTCCKPGDTIIYQHFAGTKGSQGNVKPEDGEILFIEPRNVLAIVTDDGEKS